MINIDEYGNCVFTDTSSINEYGDIYIDNVSEYGSLSFIPIFILTLTDSISIAENLVKSVTYNLSDLVIIQENLIKMVYKYIINNIGISSISSKQILLLILYDLIVTDIINIIPIRILLLFDNVNSYLGLRNSVNKNISNNINISEIVSYTQYLLLSITNTIDIVSGTVKSINIDKFDGIIIDILNTHTLNKFILNNITLIYSLIKSNNINKFDTVIVTDTRNSYISKLLNNIILLHDYIIKSLNIIKTDNIYISDNRYNTLNKIFNNIIEVNYLFIKCVTAVILELANILLQESKSLHTQILSDVTIIDNRHNAISKMLVEISNLTDVIIKIVNKVFIINVSLIETIFNKGRLLVKYISGKAFGVYSKYGKAIDTTNNNGRAIEVDEYNANAVYTEELIRK